ncbi:MAG: TonB-dependent receptor, partial [Saprospiraceae bacterium]|nr:TonB-dependent receptor [Saprospiraceae bacterium]
MKSTILTAFFLCVVFVLQAQKISGVVLHSDGTPAEFATVLLHNAADSTLVKGAISNDTGNFDFEQIQTGKYFLRSNLVGSGAVVSDIFDYQGVDLQLPSLKLQAAGKELAQVTITARKPIVEVKADKTILNVEGNINAQGQNALELLRKAPGVTIDNNDNVAVKGKNSVRFQIDGRDVPMDSKDLVNFLKGMRAEDIAAIEMITNPSAKYDASGNAGIINIRTKKNKNLGTNGSAGAELIYGESLKGGVNFSLNHRNKRVNLFGNYSNHFGDWHNTLNLLRDQQGQQTDPTLPNYDPSRRYDQQSQMVDSNNSHNFKFGSDYFINSKHTVGFIVDGRHNHGPWQNNARTAISSLDNLNEVESILVASNYQPQDRGNFNINANYRFADTSGHELNIDLNRGFYRYRADSYQPNTYYDATEQTVLSQKIYRNNTPTDIDMIIAKVDYEQNLWKGKLGVGFKFNNVETDNVFDFFIEKDGTPYIDTTRSNRFVYHEMVNAGYVNYNVQLKKWGFQAGLRAEHTDWKGELTSLQPGKDEMPSDQYLSFFPSGAVTYSLNEKNQFNLTYSRR